MHGSKPEHPNSPRLQQMSSATAAAQPRRDGKERVRERGRCVRGVVWCVWCVADVCRWVPVMFISSVVLWSYYAYTVELCFKAVDNLLQRTLYLLCYHVLFVLFTWSYARTIFTDPGFPQKRFYLTASQLDSLTRAQTEEEEANVLKVVANSLPLLCRQVNGGVRYCKVCVVVKPDRCHHCSICRRCVLKMDHHCPWVNNCVGFHNYKLFLLFLFYASLYCFYVSLSDLPFFIHYWQLTNSSSQQVALGHRMQIIFLGLVASMFILGVFSLLCYHIFLLLHNRTTIESFRLPVFVTGDSQSRRGFGIGWKNNFIQVFGSQPKYWLLPVASSMGNGNTFPVAQREPESGFLLREDYCHEDTGSDRGEMFGFGSAPLVGVPLASVPPTGKLSLLEEEDANSGDHQLEEILNGAHSHSLHKLSTASSCSGDSSSANSEKKLVNQSQHHQLQHHHQQQNQNQKQLNDYSVDLLGLPNSANPKNEHSFESLDKELTEDMA